MKKFLTSTIILLLLIWNSVLSYEVFFKEGQTTVNPDGTIVQTVVTEFDTNVSQGLPAQRQCRRLHRFFAAAE